MTRVLHILGALLLVAACAVFVLLVGSSPCADPHLEAVLNCPCTAERLRQDPNGCQSIDKKTPALIAAAEAFSWHLNPPKSPEKSSVSIENSAPLVPPIRPPAPSVKFRLCATSYYPNQPGRSMALIAELGPGPGSERWVKEGTHLGHFIIQEIRRGAIVYRDGDNLREMAVERSTSLPSIVRDLRPGSVRVSAAISDTGDVISVPTGPNGIEIAGGN